MASLGSLFSSFTGDSQKRRADEANRLATGFMQSGFDQGSGFVKDYNERGNTYLNPYEEMGRKANALYGRFTGLDGANAQRAAFADYNGADPFREYNADQAGRAISRQYNKLGMLDSGNWRYALAKANLDRGSEDFNTHLNRIGQLGQMGVGAAGVLANQANQTGGVLGNMRMNLGNAQAGNAINYQNSLAAADGIFGNNLLKVAGLGMGFMNPSGKFGPSADKATSLGNNFSGYTPQQMQSMNGYF